MKEINLKKLAFITLITPCAFYWGMFLENIFEPFVGAVLFTVAYLLLLCGRAPGGIRAIACFVMSWILFFFAQRINEDMQNYNAPLLELDDELSLLEAKIVFGYHTQAIISGITAVIAYFVGKSKFITVDN